MAYRKLAYEEVLGRYRLLARLGHGGMAEVFLVRLIGAGGFEKLVAVKRMLSSLSSDRTFVTMFLNEGRIAALLDHPNICHVYELDEANGTLFLAMEFLRGLPWSEIVPAIPDRPQATLVRFVAGTIMQTCEGLHHAHTAIGIDGRPRPVVHRDISPSNLFVTNEGIVKLLDFGVSKVLTEPAMTASGMIKGKLPYMAPEQLKGRPVDVRADIFSLAVVTWEAIAGRALFDRKSDYEVMQAVTEADIPRLPGEGPVIERLDATLRRALARDRTQRYGSARDFAGDLCRAVAACGEPMTSSEVQGHLSTWLGPSLARRGRDLAELLGHGRQSDDMTGEQTSVHEPAPIAGGRLRDVSVVIGDNALDTATTTEDLPLPNSANAIVTSLPVPTINLRGVEMPKPTINLMQPYVAHLVESAPVGRPAWTTTVFLPAPPRLQRRRLAPLTVAIVAVVAIVTGLLITLLLV